jgi:hypothetical protein
LLKPALGEVNVRGFELPLDLYVILRGELLRPPAETLRAQGTPYFGNARCHTRNEYTGSGSRSPGLKPLFEQERLAVEWFLVSSLVESHEGAVGLQFPSVDDVGERRRSNRFSLMGDLRTPLCRLSFLRRRFQRASAR